MNATIEPIAVSAQDDLNSATRQRFPFPLAMAVLAFLSSYFQLFIFPNTPTVPWGDQVLWLENARRILRGLLPYRDYLQWVTPGTELLYAALFRVWHARAWIPNLAMVILASALALLTTFIAKRFFSGVAVAIPALLLAGFVLPSSLYATHHWFSTAAVLLAVLCWIDRVDVPRAVAVGLLCGIAADFTQSAGAAALLGMTAFLFVEGVSTMRRAEFVRRCAALWGGAGAAFLSVNGYFIWISGLRRFVFCTIVFPLRYWRSVSSGNWRAYGEQFRLNMGIGKLLGFGFVHLLVPFVYLAWFVYRRKYPALREEQKRAERLIVLSGLALFLAIASAPSFLRLCTAAPPAVILLAVLLQEKKPARWVLNAATWAALVLAVGMPVRNQQHLRGFLLAPSGRIAFLDQARFDEFRWLLGNSVPGEPFFGHPPACFALALTNPTPVNFMTATEFTRPSEVTAIVAGLEDSRAPMLLLPADEDFPSKISPSIQATLFQDYVKTHYRLVRRFPSGDEAWFRKDSVVINP